jgi:glycosyltransferase family protein
MKKVYIYGLGKGKDVLERCLRAENLLIAIADNYGALDKYTDAAATGIRQYLSNGVREEHMQLLDLNRTYYDAYLSRTYLMYRDKEGAKERFCALKKLWDEKEVLVVEGEHTRFGVGNDLLQNAKSVERILTLDKDSFSVYDSLFEVVKKHGRGKLILIVLGPVATIMAHDLAKSGFWAVDIGQLDVEYEWYLRGAEKGCNIPYKTVSELTQYEGVQTDKEAEWIREYENQMIEYVM